MHSVESYLTDAFYESDTLLGFIRPHTHTRRGIWKYFPLFVYVLDCVVLGFGHMPWEAMFDVLSAPKAERIIECAGQGEVLLK